jgi:hypothetical protein
MEGSVIAHTHGQLYAYEFQIYRDLGPQFEMPFLRTATVKGTNRVHATGNLNLASDERAVWFGWRS